jgi:gliding motility-associated-like protein
MRKLILFILIFTNVSLINAQSNIWIKPNKGQWHENVEYKIGIPSGDMYLEKNGFTYSFSNINELHNHSHETNHEEEYKRSIVRAKFINANPNPTFSEIGRSDHYENYYLGSNKNKWVSQLYLFNEINYIELYEGINLNIYEKSATLKYDIIISPHTDPGMYKVDYSGQDKIEIIDEELIISTSIATITEKKPYAYQIINGIKQKVECNFKLDRNVMSFEFPENYDSTIALVIDPELAFSTFTGSTSDNWGMTACPDVNGNLIAAGVVFGTGYPTQNAYDASMNSNGNSKVDIGLTKFSADGSTLIYSTYIGGSGSETPHSIVVNDQNELYILGATSSPNFPVSGSAYQGTNSLGGGINSMDGMNFGEGIDIFIFKLSANGASMLASTFLGGSGTDGISYGNTDIAFNYGDNLRGEIIVDANSNVFISSTTKSSNFPIIGGFGNSLSGTQDGIIAKLNPNLSSLLFSTYIGGSGWDSGNSIQLASNGDIYVAGGTTSNNFPSTAGQVNPTFLGGSTDGFVIKLTAPAYNNPKASYLGTNEYDQAYFVQLDQDDKVYVYGQTEGSYPVSAAQYSVANSGQFIHKMNSNLTSTEWSSVFGAGSGHVEISPTAFLVSDCYEIYIAGWGGETNQNNTDADFSTTNGFPVTADAYQPTTSGSNFYLALFTQDMLTLKYATFMGSLNGSNDHVDGGTSRFDKTGKVYHAVCAACQGNENGFPTTAGAYSTTNNSSNCNMAAFLFELSKIEATLSTGTPITCIPNATFFENNSENGDTYEWIFGDGGTSNQFEPSHQYTESGEYNVMLIVSDANGCYDPDTAYVQVIIIEPIYEAWPLTDTICPGETVQVFATGGAGYSWGPPELFDNPNIASPFVTIYEETELTVEITSDCGATTLNITVYVFGADATSGLDTAICVGGSAQLYASGGETYDWAPEETLNNPNISNPLATPFVTTYYTVEIITPEGCVIMDTTKVRVDQDIPYPNMIDEVSICKGDEIQITANGATDYLWSPDYNINSTVIYNPVVNPEITTSYAVAFTNACGTAYDTVDVNVIEVIGDIVSDTIICPEGFATLWANGGVSYEWTPNIHLTRPHEDTTIATPNIPTTYYVQITDEFGCRTILSTYIDIFISPTVIVSPTVYGFVGDTTLISAEGDGNIEWSPPQYINCTVCNDALVSPPNNFIYTATLTDDNTCIVSDDIIINYDPIIFVPNAFTPDGDEYNNTFFASANNISEFEMMIFNRWGELIFVGESIHNQWDGSYAGQKSPDGIYIWKINYKDLNGLDFELVGHVALLR